MAQKFLAGVGGAYTSAKLDFLTAASVRDPETGRYPGVYVNRMHCRPLHPHGAKMIREGFMRLERNYAHGGRCAHSSLVITDAGLAELARLQKRAAKHAKRHEGPVDPLPRTRGWMTGRAAQLRRTKAIAFLKAA